MAYLSWLILVNMDSLYKVWVIVYRQLEDGIELLLLKPNPEPDMDRDFYVITGGIEQGETVKEAAMRETHEEIGVEPLSIIDLNNSFEYTNIRNGLKVTERCFLAKVSNGSNITLNEEHIAYKWVSIEEFRKDIWWVGPREPLHELLNKVHKLITH